MSTKANKLLDKARSTQKGWRRNELLKLYEQFGFVLYYGKKHDIIKHPKYKELRATITRSSNELHPDYVKHAIKIIEEVISSEGSAYEK